MGSQPEDGMIGQYKLARPPFAVTFKEEIPLWQVPKLLKIAQIPCFHSSGHETIGLFFLERVSDLCKQHFGRRCSRRRCRWLFPFHTVGHLDQLEQNERQDYELDQDSYEVAIGKCGASFLGFIERRCTFRTTELDKLIRKIHPASSQTGYRHNQIFDQRRYDFSKGGAHDDANCKIEGIAFESKILEFLKHGDPFLR